MPPAVMLPTTPPATEPSPPSRRSPGGWAFFWGAVFLLLAGLVTYLIFSAAGADFQTVDAKRVLEREKILADRLSDDQKLLHDQPSWLNKDKGLVRIPIERAMSMTVAELSQMQPHPAYPVSQSPPQPASALLNYGTRAPGKAVNQTPTLPPGAPLAGSPAPAPASALPSATPVPASPDAAAAIGKSSPAPAPILVAPPTPSPAPATPAAATAPPAAPATSQPSASPSSTPAP